jgi:hypothetical protein
MAHVDGGLDNHPVLGLGGQFGDQGPPLCQPSCPVGDFA